MRSRLVCKTAGSVNSGAVKSGWSSGEFNPRERWLRPGLNSGSRAGIFQHGKKKKEKTTAELWPQRGVDVWSATTQLSCTTLFRRTTELRIRRRKSPKFEKEHLCQIQEHWWQKNTNPKKKKKHQINKESVTYEWTHTFWCDTSST